MKKCVLILYFLLLASTVMAQNVAFEIKGSVNGVMDSIPLESATIYLQNSKDNSLIKYTTSNQKGEFALSGNTAQKEATLFISYVGSKTFSKNITLQPKIDLKTIYLENTALLDAVMIESTLPVTIKQDTLEFDPKAFKTKKNATVEDFIKKLPGVQVDIEGNITINGTSVDKILINGKPFFSNDPTMATQNLTKEIIEKLQVTDTKTNAEAFTGEVTDRNAKTINLVIKEENNKGAFGKLATGVGDQERYNVAGNYNKFNNDLRLSLIGNGNNINAPQVGVGTKGIRTSQKGGISYADNLSENQLLSVDYIYLGTEFENATTRFTEYIVPDAPYFSNANSNALSEGNEHTVNLQYEALIDDTFHIDLNSSFRSLSSDDTFQNSSETFDASQELINTSDRQTNNSGVRNSFKNQLYLTKKIGAKGAFIKTSLYHNVDVIENDDFTMSALVFLNSNNDDILRDQFTDTNGRLQWLNTGITARLPVISKKLFLDFSYTHTYQKEESDRAVFDFDENQQGFDTFNSMLSSDFINKNISNTPSLKLSYRNKKISTFLNFEYIFRTLENQDRLRSELNIQRHFDIFTYSGGFRYRLTNRSVINSGVKLSNTIPSLRQLQSFTDVSDPLNITTGNPNLKPQNRYTFHVDFRTNNFKKGMGLYSKFKVDFENNRVVSRYTINDDLVRETTFVNVDGNYGYHSYVNLYKRFKLDKIRSLRVNVNGFISTSKRTNFNGDVRYNIKTTNYFPSIELDFEWQNMFNIVANYDWNYTKTNYSLEGFNNEEIIFHTLDLYTETNFFEHLTLENTVRYTYNPNVSDDFDKFAWSWNSALSYSFLNDTAILSFKIYDILNQNINTRRIVSPDFIQNTQSLVLKRFFMIGFEWKFNSLKKPARPG